MTVAFKKSQTRGLKAAIKAAGNMTALARLLGVTGEAVYQWDEVPIRRAAQIAKLTGVPLKVLRPDLFDHTMDSASEPSPR